MTIERETRETFVSKSIFAKHAIEAAIADIRAAGMNYLRDNLTGRPIGVIEPEIIEGALIQSMPFLTPKVTKEELFELWDAQYFIFAFHKNPISWPAHTIRDNQDLYVRLIHSEIGLRELLAFFVSRFLARKNEEITQHFRRLFEVWEVCGNIEIPIESLRTFVRGLAVLDAKYSLYSIEQIKGWKKSIIEAKDKLQDALDYRSKEQFIAALKVIFDKVSSTLQNNNGRLPEPDARMRSNKAMIEVAKSLAMQSLAMQSDEQLIAHSNVLQARIMENGSAIERANLKKQNANAKAKKLGKPIAGNAKISLAERIRQSAAKSAGINKKLMEEIKSKMLQAKAQAKAGENK